MESDEKLSLDPVPSAEFFGPTLSHVAAADDCGPPANLFQVFGKNYRPFDRYERIRSAIILDAKSGKERSGEVSTLHGVSACIEDDVPVVVRHKPNWSDVWPPIGSGGGERPRASWIRRKKGIHFVGSHQMVGHQVVLARGRSHVSLPRTRAIQAPNDWPTNVEVSHPPGVRGQCLGCVEVVEDAETGINVQCRVNWLSPLPLFVKANVTIDGRSEVRSWGRHFLPMPPGPHEVSVSFG